MTPESSPKAYHHGDLHNALVRVALEILEEQGVEGVSLRQIANRIQVSHSAPYHYFKSKSALLATLAAEGFRRMVDQIAIIAASNPNDVDFRLRAVGRGYVQFALGSPNLFRLMFRPELTRPDLNVPLQEAQGLAFGALYQAIEAFLGSGHGPTEQLDCRSLAAYAWSGVHGFCVLQISQMIQQTSVAELPTEQIAEALIEFIMRGITSVKRDQR
jgi:AcrR family transcriptional regulator